MASGIAEHVPAAGVFVKASSSSEWCEHLQPRGSCFSLLSLLVKQRELIHELGPKGITVLHKGVHHGCVALVKFILVSMFDDEGHCTCREHGPGGIRLTREQLLRKACEDDITAVQMAVVSGSPKMVLLLKWAIDKNELELKQKNKSSSKGDEVTSSDAARVRIRRVQHRSTRNALLFAGEEWDMEGEEMRRLFEVAIREECDPSTPPEVGPSDAEEEVVDETLAESVNDSDSNNLVVPDVRDDTVDCVYEDGSEESVMIPRVYGLIERLLEDPDGFEADIQEDIKIWKNKCMKDVDFEFVPVAHVFLHFLFGSVLQNQFNPSRASPVFKRIIRACYEHDLKEQGNPQGSGSMVAILFKILDPRGRTFLHAALSNVETIYMFHFIFRVLDTLDLEALMSIEVVKKCMNTKDGAGRSILHLMCTLEHEVSTQALPGFKRWDIINNVDWDAKLSPLCHEELDALRKWCFPQYHEGCSYKAIHLAILFNSITMFNPIYLYSKEQEDNDFDASDAFNFSKERERDFTSIRYFAPIQLAGFLGRPTIIEEILKQPGIKRIYDIGIDGKFITFLEYYPALHCAALSGQVEAIQSILKFPIYDPFIQHQSSRYGIKSQGTALHYLLKRKNFKSFVTMFQTISLLHVLPNSKSYARLKEEFSKLYVFSEHKLEMFSPNEMSCINLLLQAGIDIWTPHCETGERPSPGPKHNDTAREWWYKKVVHEVVTQKTSINTASNATSVIATLVATASFIGPLQPPLGLADDGFLHTGASAVRVYFVCNGLSFYFSIASILMAVLPAIPMPKESLYDELFRSQRCLKTAALLLLVSIMCILTSFTSASFAVVSSEQHDTELVGVYVGIGGVVCVIVLVVYMIRMLRMVFHKNDHFRRWFAKNMKF